MDDVVKAILTLCKIFSLPNDCEVINSRPCHYFLVYCRIVIIFKKMLNKFGCGEVIILYYYKGWLVLLCRRWLKAGKTQHFKGCFSFILVDFKNEMILGKK